ncbi:MAG: hypothetical protein ABMB14_20225 [Myxococcota bacterium]
MIAAWLGWPAAAEVVVVVTPGVGLDAYRPLLAALANEDVDPVVITVPCSGDAEALAAIVRRRLAEVDQPVVVAHGLGATLALLADADVHQYVFLGPVLGVPGAAALDDLATVPVGARVDLRAPRPWGEHDLRQVLLGATLPALGCFPAALARDLQGWIAARHVPLALDQVTAPVWLGVGLLDELAPPEVVIPTSRALPDRTVVRLGIARFDPVDYDHAALLAEPAPLRAAARVAARADR